MVYISGNTGSNPKPCAGDGVHSSTTDEAPEVHPPRLVRHTLRPGTTLTDRIAMNANGERLNATAEYLADDAPASVWNARMRSQVLQMRAVGLKIRQLHHKIDVLQYQLATLVAHLQNSGAPLAPSTLSSLPSRSREPILEQAFPSSSSAADEPSIPAYLGPTSSVFGLDRAQAEYPPGDGHDPSDSDWTELGRAVELPLKRRRPMAEHGGERETGFEIDKVEAQRLIQTFEETTGSVYPCLDVENVKALADEIFDVDGDPLRMTRRSHQHAGTSATFDHDLEILRIILALGYVIDEHGRSDAGARLMDRVEDAMYRRFKVFEVDTKELLILLLMSFYHFHRGDEISAYRTTGLAARGALEMGLHRRSTWERTSGVFRGELQRAWAVKLFWCIYILDRRWSLGTGLPFAMQDADMDAELPELDETTPYLRCMVAYGKLASKVWQAVASCEKEARRSELEATHYLDWLVQQWSESIPPELQLQTTFQDPSTLREQTQILLQTILHLMANQMRIILHRPDLLSKERIMRNISAAHLVVKMASDSIQLIDRLNRTTEIYQKQPAAFDYFLISALAALFLTASYAPNVFAHQVHDDMQTALALVKGFLPTSLSARRLWKTIRYLRHKGPRLNPVSTAANRNSRIVPRLSPIESLPDNDGTRGSDGAGMDSPTSALGSLDVWPSDGFQVSQELDSMFHAVELSCVRPTPNGSTGGEEWFGDGSVGTSDNQSNIFHVAEHDTEFSRLFMELF